MGMGSETIEWKIELLTVLCICFSSITVADITLTISPSNDVEVNQTVTLTCELDPNPTPPIIVSFENNFTEKLCVLEHRNGKCKNTSDICVTRYNASCPRETLYSLQVNVPWNWNGVSVHCQTVYSKSNSIVLDVKVKPEVTSLTPSPYRVSEGQTATLSCLVLDANPNTSIAWRWFRAESPYNVLYNGLTYTIPSIQRTRSGSYSCTASNSVGTSEAVSIFVDVLFKPEVTSLTPRPYRVLEGQTATLSCVVLDANPNTNIAWRWFSTESPYNVLHNGSTYTIPSIQRTRSGSYSCTASNSVGTSEAVSIVVDVLYKPHIIDTPRIIVNESDRAILTKEIVSNPLSNVSWYNGSELLLTQSSVRTTTILIEKAMCTDTKNFTLRASNTVERNVAALVELIVNCKPRTHRPNITLGVPDTNGIDFSTTFIAYPEPSYELRFENGKTNHHMICSIIRNAVNNYTFHFNQTVVHQNDYGVYLLRVNNSFGETTVFVNILPQRKPNKPTTTESVCEVTRARVQWKSSFNGGDHQSFTVIVLNGHDIESKSDTISDKGENEIHSIFIQNLKPSTPYVFYVSARNSHGFSSSENISCTTLEEPSNTFPVIVGGAAAAGIALTVAVIVVVVLRILKKPDNQERNNPIRTNEDASQYTTLAERDVTTERNFYERLSQNKGANHYEACIMKERQETNGQMYESLKRTEITVKRNISDKQMTDKNPKDLSTIYVNHSVMANTEEYINLSFAK